RHARLREHLDGRWEPRGRGASGGATRSRCLRRHHRRRARSRDGTRVAPVPATALGLAADGVPGQRTREALGRYGRRAPLGSRPLALGARGWDVAALQFALALHGFPSGAFDGYLGAHTDAARRRFQAWAGITPDGTAGPRTVAALRGPPPRSRITFSRPLPGPTGDLFGPRGPPFPAGGDLPAPFATAVTAPRPGRAA